MNIDPNTLKVGMLIFAIDPIYGGFVHEVLGVVEAFKGYTYVYGSKTIVVWDEDTIPPENIRIRRILLNSGVSQAEIKIFPENVIKVYKNTIELFKLLYF